MLFRSLYLDLPESANAAEGYRLQRKMQNEQFKVMATQSDLNKELEIKAKNDGLASAAQAFKLSVDRDYTFKMTSWLDRLNENSIANARALTAAQVANYGAQAQAALMNASSNAQGVYNLGLLQRSDYAKKSKEAGMYNSPIGPYLPYIDKAFGYADSISGLFRR